jgi:TRAP-type C4-dicarboxylate transport system permease small subunit
MSARARALLVWIAGGALLVAMLTDTVAMLGRQVQVPLLGAIEIVQTAVLFAASGALLIAALDHAHARVRLVLDRLPTPWQRALGKVHALGAALLYLALLAGTAWIASDLWNGHEESELLRIPYRPLRVTAVLTLGALVVHSLLRLRAREPQ